MGRVGGRRPPLPARRGPPRPLTRDDPLGKPHHRIAAWIPTEQQRDDQKQQGNDRKQELDHRQCNLTHAAGTPEIATGNVRRMQPGRGNIAAPELPPGIEWVGGEPRPMSALTAGGPVLVHFLDFAQLNSVRTLPYLAEWDRRYRDAGLTTFGMQAPRFPFGADPNAVAAGLRRLGIDFPIAIDADRTLWHAYGCEGWPSLFLWKMGGALAWFHFGEGEYRGTEEAIQAELREQDALRELPAPMAPLRQTDGPEARVMPPTEELFPGGSWERPWTAGLDDDSLDVPYEAGGAYATVEGSGEVAVELDGGSTGRQGGSAEPIRIDGPAFLYALAEHPRHERHMLTLRPSPGLRIWSISFAAGVP